MEIHEIPLQSNPRRDRKTHPGPGIGLQIKWLNQHPPRATIINGGLRLVAKSWLHYGQLSSFAYAFTFRARAGEMINGPESTTTHTRTWCFGPENRVPRQAGEKLGRNVCHKFAQGIVGYRASVSSRASPTGTTAARNDGARNELEHRSSAQEWPQHIYICSV